MFCCLSSLAEEAFPLRDRVFLGEVGCCLVGLFGLAAAALVKALDFLVELEALGAKLLVDVVVLLAVSVAVLVAVGLLGLFSL